MTAIYVALVIYMVVLFGVGLFYSKKNATINDFLLAGHDLGVVAATLTVTASLFGRETKVELDSYQVKPLDE